MSHVMGDVMTEMDYHMISLAPISPLNRSRDARGTHANMACDLSQRQPQFIQASLCNLDAQYAHYSASAASLKLPQAYICPLALLVYDFRKSSASSPKLELEPGFLFGFFHYRIHKISTTQNTFVVLLFHSASSR